MSPLRHVEWVALDALATADYHPFVVIHPAHEPLRARFACDGCDDVSVLLLQMRQSRDCRVCDPILRTGASRQEFHTKSAKTPSRGSTINITFGAKVCVCVCACARQRYAIVWGNLHQKVAFRSINVSGFGGPPHNKKTANIAKHQTQTFKSSWAECLGS